MNPTSIFDHVKLLYECELYSECIRLASLLISAHDQARTILNPQEHFLTFIYLADSLYDEGRYRQADSVYRHAMLSKRLLSKSKVTCNKSLENLTEQFSDAYIKFKLAKCLFEMRRCEDAITLLNSIQLKQRTPKINFFLGKLTQFVNHERSSIAAFKEVVKECPMALESMEKLMEMGVRGVEINSLMLDATLLPQCSDWLCTWIKAHDLINSKKYTQALQILRSIESNSFIRNSNMLLNIIGHIYYLMGDYDNAKSYLKPAFAIYSTSSMGIQLYAKLLAKKKKIQELEKLIPLTSSTSEYTSEMWYIMAQYLFSTGKFEKAAFFAQKALFINPINVEALLLKSRVYIEVKKLKEALLLLRVVQQLVPYRFEVYKLLVNVYMNMYRIRDAHSAANLAIKTIGQTSRTLVLLAETYTNDVHLKPKVKPLLQKALELNEHYLPAVVRYSEHLQAEGDISGAICLLKKQVAVQPNCTLHTMLGEMLKSIKDQDGALEHYTVALNLDPNDRQAMAGIISMGKSTAGNVDNSYTTTSSTNEESIINNATDIANDFQELVELVPPPDPDPESESDAMWSDVEIEINNG